MRVAIRIDMAWQVLEAWHMGRKASATAHQGLRSHAHWIGVCFCDTRARAPQPPKRRKRRPEEAWIVGSRAMRRVLFIATRLGMELGPRRVRVATQGRMSLSGCTKRVPHQSPARDAKRKVPVRALQTALLGRENDQRLAPRGTASRPCTITLSPALCRFLRGCTR